MLRKGIFRFQKAGTVPRPWKGFADDRSSKFDTFTLRDHRVRWNSTDGISSPPDELTAKPNNGKSKHLDSIKLSKLLMKKNKVPLSKNSSKNQKCQQIIAEIFKEKSPSAESKDIGNKSSIEKKKDEGFFVKSTFDKEHDEAKLAQKLEELKEVPVVEAQHVEEFETTPKTLNFVPSYRQIHPFLYTQIDKALDELATQCLNAAATTIDDDLLNKMNKGLKKSTKTKVLSKVKFYKTKETEETNEVKAYVKSNEPTLKDDTVPHLGNFIFNHMSDVIDGDDFEDTKHEQMLPFHLNLNEVHLTEEYSGKEECINEQSMINDLVPSKYEQEEHYYTSLLDNLKTNPQYSLISEDVKNPIANNSKLESKTPEVTSKNKPTKPLNAKKNDIESVISSTTLVFGNEPANKTTSNINSDRKGNNSKKKNYDLKSEQEKYKYKSHLSDDYQNDVPARRDFEPFPKTVSLKSMAKEAETPKTYVFLQPTDNKKDIFQKMVPKQNKIDTNINSNLGGTKRHILSVNKDIAKENPNVVKRLSSYSGKVFESSLPVNDLWEQIKNNKIIQQRKPENRPETEKALRENSYLHKKELNNFSGALPPTAKDENQRVSPPLLAFQHPEHSIQSEAEETTKSHTTSNIPEPLSHIRGPQIGCMSPFYSQNETLSEETFEPPTVVFDQPEITHNVKTTSKSRPFKTSSSSTATARTLLVTTKMEPESSQSQKLPLTQCFAKSDSGLIFTSDDPKINTTLKIELDGKESFISHDIENAKEIVIKLSDQDLFSKGTNGIVIDILTQDGTKKHFKSIKDYTQVDYLEEYAINFEQSVDSLLEKSREENGSHLTQILQMLKEKRRLDQTLDYLNDHVQNFKCNKRDRPPCPIQECPPKSRCKRPPKRMRRFNRKLCQPGKTDCGSSSQSNPKCKRKTRRQECTPHGPPSPKKSCLKFSALDLAMCRHPMLFAAEAPDLYFLHLLFNMPRYISYVLKQQISVEKFCAAFMRRRSVSRFWNHKSYDPWVPIPSYEKPKNEKKRYYQFPKPGALRAPTQDLNKPKSQNFPRRAFSVPDFIFVTSTT